MKRLFFLLIIIASLTKSFSQVLNPIKWKSSVEKLSETEYNLVTTAIIEKGWHLYSQNVPKRGPVPTSFTYKPNANYTLIGATIEDIGVVKDDKTFNMQIKYFTKKAVFKQKIALKSPSATINADVEFMVCDEVRCLPPKVKTFVFNAPKGSGTTNKRNYK